MRKDTQKLANKKYYEKNKEKLNKKTALNNKVWRRRKRTEALKLLGNKCIKCGFSDIRALQVDHINGGGSEDKKSKGRASYFNYVIKSVLKKENKFQLLCANCNWIKRVENNEIRNGKIIN